jgi:maltose O-acetyltransferase
MKSDLPLQTRNKFLGIISLILYYGLAYWLPNFDSHFGGKVSNAIRVWCARNIFEYVGQGVNIGRKARFGNGCNIRIGSRSNIGAYCQIPSNIVIGDNVMMGPNNFFFGGFTHNIDDTTRPMIEQGFKILDGRTEIGDDVWIGRECLFMPCKKIGSHSVVGARSVVTKDVPEYVIVGGNPAKVIKERK